MIKGLHHNAYRCRDSEATRRFYEDFLGLPLAGAFPIRQTKTGRATEVLHSFSRLGDGSFLAFFEAPDQPFEFKPQHDFDLHIALEIDEDAFMRATQATSVSDIAAARHMDFLIGRSPLRLPPPNFAPFPPQCCHNFAAFQARKRGPAVLPRAPS